MKTAVNSVDLIALFLSIFKKSTPQGVDSGPPGMAVPALLVVILFVLKEDNSNHNHSLYEWGCDSEPEQPLDRRRIDNQSKLSPLMGPIRLEAPGQYILEFRSSETPPPAWLPT